MDTSRLCHTLFGNLLCVIFVLLSTCLCSFIFMPLSLYVAKQKLLKKVSAQLSVFVLYPFVVVVFVFCWPFLVFVVVIEMVVAAVFLMVFFTCTCHLHIWSGML